jgi:hypothetical protein
MMRGFEEITASIKSAKTHERDDDKIKDFFLIGAHQVLPPFLAKIIRRGYTIV